LLCVVCGVVLLFVGRFRRVGVYTITMTTAALLCSLAVSTAVLYAGPRLVKAPPPSWYGVAVIGAYVVAIGAGGIAGGVGGFFVTRRLLPSK
jgi:hypothetical protein